MENKPITIVGAGLVGSLLACFLAKRGMQVSIYEKRPDMRRVQLDAGRSINLSLSIRGAKALEKVGLFEKVRPYLTKMYGREIHDEQGTHFQPYGQFDDCFHYSMDRAHLNKLLMTSAESTGFVQIYFEHECSHIDFDKKQITFENKNSKKNINFEHLIATDGGFSKVRQALIEHTKGQFSIEPLAHGYKELTMPALPNGQHAIKQEALHIWPRDDFMLIGLPNVDGSYTLTLFMAHEGAISFASLDSKHKIKEFFEHYFPDITKLVPDYLNQYENNPVGNMITVRALPWHYQDKVLLMGDAAHAIVPFHGQGMNCGFEDCEALDGLISCYSSVETIFSQFEQIRKPNADAIATMAIENYLEMRQLVKDPDFLEKKKLAFELERKYPKLFKPRYSMVMFDTMPYSVAYQKGKRQAKMLEHIAAMGMPSSDKLESMLSEL